MEQEVNKNSEDDFSGRIVLGFKGYLLSPLLLMIILLWFPPQLPATGGPGSLSALYGNLPYSGLFLTLYPHTGYLIFIVIIFRSMVFTFSDVIQIHKWQYNLLATGLFITSILIPLLGFMVLGFTDLFHLYIIGPYTFYTIILSLGTYYHIRGLELETGHQLMLLRGSYSLSKAQSRFFLRPIDPKQE